MPFKSKAQQRWMFAKKPQMAKEFAAATPNIKSLPNKVAAIHKGLQGGSYGRGKGSY